MDTVKEADAHFLSRCALLLFIAGLLGPILIALAAMAVLDGRSTDAAAGLAYGFGFIAEILALIFGIASRKHIGGKIGMYGSLSVILVVGVVSFGWFTARGAGPSRPVNVAVPVMDQNR